MGSAVDTLLGKSKATPISTPKKGSAVERLLSQSKTTPLPSPVVPISQEKPKSGLGVSVGDIGREVPNAALKVGKEISNFFIGNTKKLITTAGKNVGEATAYFTSPEVRATVKGNNVNQLLQQQSELTKKLSTIPQGDKRRKQILTAIKGIGKSLQGQSSAASEVLPEQMSVSGTGEGLKKIAGQAVGSAAELASFAKAGKVIKAGQAAKSSIGKIALQGAKSGGLYGTAFGVSQGLQENKSAGQTVKSGLVGGATGAVIGGAVGALLAKAGKGMKTKVTPNTAQDAGAYVGGIQPPKPTTFKTVADVKKGIQGTLDDIKMTERVKQSDPQLFAEMAKQGKAVSPDPVSRARDIAMKLDDWKPGTSQQFLKNVEGKNLSVEQLVNEANNVVDTVGTQDSVARITQALKEAAPIRKSQEAMYSKVRSQKLAQAMAMGKKVGGEKGFYAQLGALKGELPKAQFESLRGKIPQQDIDQIMERIRTSPNLQGFKQITAQEGMMKLFGQYGGEVPTTGELNLLRAEFGDDFVKTVLEKRPFLEKLKEAGIQAINLPRALMATGDLSAPLRQGIFMAGKPKQYTKAFVKMFRYFGSEKSFNALQKEIATSPNYPLMEKSGLALTDMDHALSTREEAFISNWSEKIPIFGKLARASNRAYSGFLNKVRTDVFNDLVKSAQKQGINMAENPEVATNIARLVNAGTGRGELPGVIAKHATALNGIFFSPRLMASRVQLMNPLFYAKLDPFTRRQALGMLVKAVGGMSTVLALAKAGGAEVGTDSRSADFGKIKLGNTRVDLLGGFQQYIKLASQLMTGQVVSSTTGKVINLGEGQNPMTRLDIIGRFLESKEAPVASFFTSLIRGQNSLGQQFDISKEIAGRFYPILWGDLKELYNEQGPEMGTALTALAMLGAGVQTYGPGMEGTTTSKEADKILAEANYQPPEIKTSLVNPKNDEVIKLKGDEAKAYKKEVMDAVVKGITQAPKTPGWKEMSKQEKYDKVKNLISKEKKIVNDKWREKVFNGERKKKRSILDTILGVKEASAAELPKATNNNQKLANAIATLEGYKKKGTLADRQRNPGNLRFAGQKNAVRGERGFAKFKTHQDGFNALIAQIKLDANRNLTLRQFIYKYAPPKENNTAAYLRSVSKTLGISPDTKLKTVIK